MGVRETSRPELRRQLSGDKGRLRGDRDRETEEEEEVTEERLKGVREKSRHPAKK